MSLIPFIMELADELQEFKSCISNASMMDVDDFGFGIYPHELQTQQQQSQQTLQHRRPRSLSQLYWPSSFTKSRHHPYGRTRFPCWPRSTNLLVHDPENEVTIGITAAPATPTAADKESPASAIVAGSPSTSAASAKSAYSVVNKNGFQVSMNVKQFAPHELSVKTIDNCIVVEGQHEDKEDGHGVISRHFIRKYMLPKGYDPNEVLSTLSSDGILTVKAPPPATKTNIFQERIVDIQETGPSQFAVKDKDAATTTNKGEQAAKAATPTAVATATPAEPAAAAAGTGAASVEVVVAAIPPTAAAPPSKTIQQAAEEQEPQQQQKQILELLPQTQDLNNASERNGNGNANATEILAEPETEPAELPAVSSTNSNGITCTNNNTPTPSANTDSDTMSICDANSKTNDVEQLVSSDVVTPPAAVDAIMAIATVDEPVTVEAGDANANVTNIGNIPDIPNTDVVNEKNGIVVEADPEGDIEPEAGGDVDADVNANAEIDDDVDMNAGVDGEADLELECVELETLDTELESVDAELDTVDVKVATGNGISEAALAVDDIPLPVVGDVNIDDVETLPSAVIDEVVAPIEDEDMEEDGMAGAGVNDGGVSVNVDIGVSVDCGVGVIANDGATDAVENLVVDARPPTTGDLVAAADAAIILAKTHGENGNKPIVTEEITN